MKYMSEEEMNELGLSQEEVAKKIQEGRSNKGHDQDRKKCER